MPYGTACCWFLSGKSWDRTVTGSPASAHSRPSCPKFPTFSLFLESTLITGSPDARYSRDRAAICRNCPSRSGCCRPSWAREFDCWVKPIRLSIRQARSEEHTSELQSLTNLVCRLLLEKKKKKK